ncbi:Hsp70 chaperone protein [Fusarium heterosporum]|uniref:Hsp70 chaperone protein n=1 Tax=Fusarium heterosporum TaxID=42747 RepID=A0A8H5WKC6_FUSHE|nr:Hsp70 chaperone protein [Fusarium heterosporum]
MTANQPLNDVIVIGIDFGTTFSGVAWAYSREPDEIEIVTSWDAELNHCSDVEKAPTQLYYDSNGENVKWGFSIPSDKEPLKWFKLLLLDPKDLPADVAGSSQLQEARRLCNRINKGPIELIATFLRKLWDHSLISIKRAIGTDLVKRTKLHVVITLPAIWPPYAQQRMKQAAQQSGILDWRSAGATTLRFISEPEAAALVTIKDLAKRSTIQTGDTIVVCDAGGGTVDLISYVFESTDPFVVKECAKGDGHLCGGVFLDENFIKLVRKKSPSGSWGSVTSSDEKKFLNDQWEHGIKPQFEDQRNFWPVDLPDSCGSNSSVGFRRRITLELNSAEMLSVFSPVVSKIETLVSRQIDAIQEKYLQKPKVRNTWHVVSSFISDIACQYIILVGGFGRSRYLFNSMEKRFRSTILQSRGNKPWTAICRGAVVQGLIHYDPAYSLGVNVETRIARMSYGIRYRTPFVEGEHKLYDKVWEPKEQVFKAKNQMQWFLKEGDDISEKRSVHHDYYQLTRDAVIDMDQNIYCSTVFPPPPRYDSSRVRRMCNIKWNRSVQANQLPKYHNPLGEVFSKLNCTIKMDCEDGTVNFTVHHNGSTVGEHNVEVQFS